MDDFGFQLSLLEDSRAVYETTEVVEPELNGQRGNNLDGKAWLKNSISIWSDIRKSATEARLGHPAIFPVALAGRLIETFTNSEQNTIFDPFAGVGSTIVAAKEAGKCGIGIELNPEFAKIAQNRLLNDGLFELPRRGQGIIHIDNALNLLKYIAPENVDCVVTSPPYWDILNMKRSADYKEIRNYGQEEADLGKISDYHLFLQQLKAIFGQVTRP